MQRDNVQELKKTLERKDTNELLKIWSENNLQEWQADAFTAIKRILEERGIALPPQLAHSREAQPEDKPSIDPNYVHLAKHTRAVYNMATVLLFMGVFTMIAAFSGSNWSDDAFIHGMMITGSLICLGYGIFGFVSAKRRKVKVSGIAGLMWFGIAARRRVTAPQHVTYHLIGVLFLGSAIAWFFPLCVMLL